MKKICFVTSTRADYGLFKNLLFLVKNSKSFHLELIVTGTHFKKEFGKTVQEIKKDGFHNFKKIIDFINTDSILSITKSVGFAMYKFGKIFKTMRPDLLVVLGDRYELISSCYAATLAKIPICHFHGGEQTQGVIDEVTRNCITKLSHIHLTANKKYKKRIIQMGEDPKRVFNVGSLGVENIKKNIIRTKEFLEKKYRIKLSRPFCLATFHPETLSEVRIDLQIKPLLESLSNEKNLTVIFTSPGADHGFIKIMSRIKNFVNKDKNNRFFVKSFGEDYYSLMKYSEFLIGNSSSGIIEYPSYKKPTINIGNRQKGREKAASIIDCKNDKVSIFSSIKKARSKKFLLKLKKLKNPYDQYQVSLKSIKILRNLDYKNILIKKFIDLKNFK
jgi:GDP/UDP-N,N'-diacetylbacillosamine 2-epimerase (hydrolysing)